MAEEEGRECVVCGGVMPGGDALMERFDLASLARSMALYPTAVYRFCAARAHTHTHT